MFCPALKSCVLIISLAGAATDRKVVVNMSLNQCKALLKCTLRMKLLNCSFMHKLLMSKTNRTLWTWKGHSFFWNIKF